MGTWKKSQIGHFSQIGNFSQMGKPQIFLAVSITKEQK